MTKHNEIRPATSIPNPDENNAAHDDLGLRRLLKAEGFAMMVGAGVAFELLGGHWPWFFAFFLLPDVSLFAYLVGPRAGALAYNVAHSTLTVAALALVGMHHHEGFLFAAIFAAHIGFDRMQGYGLKSAAGFRHTHLGLVGWPKKPDATPVVAQSDSSVSSAS